MKTRAIGRKPRDFNKRNVLMMIDPFFMEDELRIGVDIDIGSYKDCQIIEHSRTLREMAQWLIRAADYIDMKAPK